MVTRDDLRFELEMSDIVNFELTDGYSYQVGVASNWLGGSDNGYMSDLIGNTEYRTVTGVLDAIFSFLEEDGREIVSAW